MNDDDAWTESMIAELRSCAECSMYFGETYMPEGTAVQQLMLWDTLFNSFKTSYIMYPTVSQARASLHGIMAAFDELPRFLKPEIVHRTTSEVLFENGSQLLCWNGNARYVQSRTLQNLAISTQLKKTEFAELQHIIARVKDLGGSVHYF